MQQLLTDYPWLVLLAAVLVGMLIMWLLEMFILRRSVKSNLTELEESLKQRDAELQTAQMTLTQSNQDLKAKGDELQSALAARAASDKQLADARAQLAKSNGDLDAALKMRQQLETTLNARTGEVNDQRAKLAALTTESNDQRAKVAALTTESNDQRAKLTALGGERDRLNAAVTSAQTELEDARAHQRGAVAEVAKLTALAAATAATVKALENSKSELGAQIETLNGELTNARVESENLRGALDEAQVARATAENELAATQTRVADLEGIQTALEGQTAELEDQNRALDADVVKLTAGALAASEIIKLLEGDKAALTEQHAALQGGYENLQRAKALDDAELAELKLQLAQVNTALGITMRDKETYQQTLAERVSELGAAQTELARAQEDNSNLLADIAKFTARAAAAAALAQGLEANKRGLTAQVEQLRAELDVERGRVAALTEAPSATADSARVEIVELAASEPAPIEPPLEEMSAGAFTEMPVIVTDEAELQPVVVAEAVAVISLVQDNGSDEEILPYDAACPQDLSAVHGIGEKFEQRLYKAGIGTYWDLSRLAEEELARMLELNETQRASVNLAAIRGDALRLARATNTQKRTWKGGAPADFDLLIGIGHVYEQRLYEAGICTYEALAGCSVEQLATICRAPHFEPHDYQSWIDQARVLVAARREGL